MKAIDRPVGWRRKNKKIKKIAKNRGLTEEHIGVCPGCNRNRFLNMGLCATCERDCSKIYENTHQNHLNFIGEILTLAARDYHRNHPKHVMPTDYQKSAKIAIIQDRKQARLFIAGKENSAFVIYCDVLGVAPGRIRRLVEEMK